MIGFVITHHANVDSSISGYLLIQFMKILSVALVECTSSIDLSLRVLLLVVCEVLLNHFSIQIKNDISVHWSRLMFDRFILPLITLTNHLVAVYKGPIFIMRLV